MATSCHCGVVVESVTITVPGELTGGRDEQGNPIREVAVPTVSTGWFVAGTGGGTEEHTDIGVSDVSRITIYNRSSVTVPSNASVTVRGRVWKVAGAVEPWVSPWGSTVGGTAVVLERQG